VSTPISSAAERLREAVRTRTPCAPVRDLIPVGDVDTAYAVQRENTDLAVAAGRRPCGHKIGLTSRAVQTQLGVPEPDFGVLFADLVHGDTEPIALSGLLQPRVEAEVAFVLGSDLDLEDATAADVLRATDHLLPAIEVVDSRVAGWDITIVDTVADNASSGAVVLGTTPVRVHGLDLRLAGMVMESRGAEVSSGAGAACLGSPVNAVVWLARELARRGTPLRAGDLVLSGALGPVVPVTGPAVFDARVDGLGSVRAVFEEVA
jgi:2-keto-4-pentenoate hydratase